MIRNAPTWSLLCVSVFGESNYHLSSGMHRLIYGRYYTVLRLALPRASIKDITYQGVVIPKGTVYFLNAWACNMDENVWPDADEFRPERWLEHPDAPMFTYGLGYRMCAGSLLANRELYLVFIRMINAFRIEKYDDVDHHPVSGNSDPTSLVAMPDRYRVKFVPRNPKALKGAMASFKVVTAEKV